jgi:ribonuclease HI
MEVQAVLEALRALPGDITIVSDSTYVVNCFRDRWWAKWERNGWRNSQKQPVANTDLWMPLIELVKTRQPTFRWVKGHSGNRLNDLVDQLAVAASKGPFGVEALQTDEAGGPLTLF